ncbi:MAG: glycosylhydrolase-like jelly roll fold domain-containing protein, partial [Terracidiphilus sp.]
PEADAMLMFVHRKLTDGDIYFVDNRSGRAESVDAAFHVEGKAPELWDAATGVALPASYQIAGGHTTVPLHLDPYGTVFVVFRKQATAPSVQLPEQVETEVPNTESDLNQSWYVTFPPARGGPASLKAYPQTPRVPQSIKFDRLTSWSDNSNAGIKYYSGTATYLRSIEIPESVIKPGVHVWLDLGDVRDLAEVRVNNQDLGILWKTPYRIDITGALRPGNNFFRIEVTNLWVNRMIGDQQPWALKKYTFADFTPYKADSPLLPSGLLGPVRLYSVASPRE